MIGSRIARTTTVDGVVTPAFIHNGSYFFVNLQVYADGLVNCWELLDLALFRDKLRSGWVVTHVPDGVAISVHALASWKIEQGEWRLDADALHARVTELVRAQNPRMENLHDCHGRTTEKRGNINVSILGSPTERPVRFVNPGAFEKRVAGDGRAILVRDDRWYLADLRVFADGTVELGRLPSPRVLDVAGVRAGVADGWIACSVTPGTRVAIHELGSFVVAETQYCTDAGELVREIPDLIDAAAGRPDSVQRCRVAYATYVAAPSDAAKDALRVAYEAVPEHNRMYVGDMDSKDWPVRRILFGDDDPADDLEE